MKIDKAVQRETSYISIWVLVLSAVMEIIFLVLGKWDYTVILGNLLGGLIAVVNFFLMGLTVQKAVQKEEKEARNLIKISQGLRMLLIIATAALGLSLHFFNSITVLVSLFFPRIAILFRQFFEKKDKTESSFETKKVKK